jgi:hypothetical protein
MKELIPVCWLLLSGTLLASHPIANSRRDYRRLDPNADAETLLERRYELELRRPRGSRPAVIENILKLGFQNADRGWSRYALQACETRISDCNEYLDTAAARVRATHGRDREVAEYDLGLFKKEAALAAMTVKQRRAFFLKALEKGRAEESGVQLDAWNAAHRALQERTYDLIGSIRKAEADFPGLQWEIIEQRDMLIARALMSADPKEELVKLVRDGVPAAVDSPPEITARLSLAELRRLDAPGTATDLKAVLDLYRPIKEKQDRELQEKIGKAQSERRYIVKEEIPSPTAYLSFLGWEIAEAIGDLGDRDFERKTLGGRTLWDQVNEAEKQLVREGKLHQSEMVSK